jgi:hypothetical protein
MVNVFRVWDAQLRRDHVNSRTIKMMRWILFGLLITKPDLGRLN